MKNKIFADKQNGFTLVEVMIAMVIFLIVTGTIYGLMRVGSLDRNRASQRSDASKNARAAVHLIGRDIFNAGLSYSKEGGSVPLGFLNSQLGFPANGSNQRDDLRSVVSGNDANPSDLQPDNTDMIAFVTRDVDFAEGQAVELVDGMESPDVEDAVRVRLKKSEQRQFCNRYDLYLAEGNEGGTRTIVMLTNLPGGTDIDKMDFAPGDPLTVNQKYTDGDPLNVSLLRKCNAAVGITAQCMNYPVILKKIHLVTYKVTPDGSLVRTRYGNNANANADAQIQEQPIAYGVENLQIKYTLYNGSTVEDPSRKEDGSYSSELLKRVRQVSVSLKVRGDGVDQATGKPTSVSHNGTFSTRNLEYEQ